MAMCPVCGDPMPLEWYPSKPRFYCSENCRSRGATLLRLEREREDLDGVVIDRLKAGIKVAATQAEYMEAAYALYQGNHKLSFADIGRTLHRTESTAARYIREMLEPQRLVSVTQARARTLHVSWLLHVPVIHRRTVIGWLLPGEVG